MDNFLRLTDEKRPARQARTGKTNRHRDITAERIEKLKKSFQPYWMRGMIPHNQDADEDLGSMTNLNQI
jgi:hypothetical protein